jgi:hypothetical protein
MDAQPVGTDATSMSPVAPRTANGTGGNDPGGTSTKAITT